MKIEIRLTAKEVDDIIKSHIATSKHVTAVGDILHYESGGVSVITEANLEFTKLNTLIPMVSK